MGGPRVRRSTTFVVAGALLLVLGIALLLSSGGGGNGNHRPGGPEPIGREVPPGQVVQPRPCPRANVQSDPGSGKDTTPDSDQEGVYRPKTRRVAATALTIAAAGVGALTSPAAADATPARQADPFVDSIGVNVHLGYTDTPYRRYDLVQKKLQELGIRHIRDGLNPGQPFVYAAWRALAKCGIKLDVIAGDPLQRWGTGTLASQLELLKREHITDALSSIEGPNEFDNQDKPNWASMLRDYQERLYSSVKADPELRQFPVIGPSLVQPESRAELGNLSNSMDYGNMHPYPGGEAPDENDHMGSELALAAKNSGSKPVQATETGYHNGVNAAGGQGPATEQAAGVYMPRLFLDYYRRGITRTYSYELLDQRPDPKHEDSESDFGLLRNDFSEKPAFKAIERLTGLLKDPGPAFKPGSLGYSLSGAPAGTRQMLFQKRDGSFYLAVWREEKVWDPDSRKAVRASSASTRLTLASSASKVSVYRPSDSGRAVATRSNVRSMPLTVTPSVSIVKIGGPGETGQGASVPYAGLKGKERRVARRLLRLHEAQAARAHRSRGMERHLAHWLSRRSARIRHEARRSGWQHGNRRVRYRAIHRVLRRA